MERGIRVARIAGIDIEVSISWFVIVVALTWMLAGLLFPDQYEGWSTATYWVVGAIAALLLFATVLVHELAHALVAVRRGLPVPRITLFFFGGVSHMARQPRTAREEFVIAVVGPLTSLVLAGLTGLAGWLIRTPEQVHAVLLYLAGVNALLAVFNILPGFPLDGGRVLRSILWGRTNSFRRATKLAGAVSEVVGYGIMGIGGVFFFFGAIVSGIWFFLIGWFLLSAARSETHAIEVEHILSRLTARQVMETEFTTIPYTLPLQRVVDEHMLAKGVRTAIVERDGAVMGILAVEDLRKLPREEWAAAPAHRVMTPREQMVAVQAEDNAAEILRKIGERKISMVPVLEEGRMIGVVGRRELMERIQLEELLREPPPPGEWPGVDVPADGLKGPKEQDGPPAP